jgi:hypothetical protein
VVEDIYPAPAQCRVELAEDEVFIRVVLEDGVGIPARISPNTQLPTGRRARRTDNSVCHRAWVCGVQAVPVAGRERDVMLAESKARENRARRALMLCLARMAHAHAEAVRCVEEFNAYMSAVEGRLRHDGYLAGV